MTQLKILTRVVEQHKGLYKVAIDSQEWWAEPSGRLLFEARDASDLPVVGDWVYATVGGPGDRLQILSVEPRKSVLARRAIEQDRELQLLAANVDHIFVVSSLNNELNPKRLDRYRALVAQSGTRGTLLLTKSDLLADESRVQRLVDSVQHVLPIIVLSVLQRRGLVELRTLLEPGATHVFIGSSGVGKSTLINTLFGEDRQETAAVREADSRGRHTTSSRSLLTLPSGALMIDTPGIRELGLWNLEEETLLQTFDEISSLKDYCRFRDCQHDSEPGCAVQAAIAAGSLDPARLASFRKLQKEQAFFERRQDKKKQFEEKNRSKALHKAAKIRRKPERD